MGIPGGTRAKSREQDKIGARSDVALLYLPRLYSSLPMPIIPQPGPKSLPMASTGSACCGLGKVRSQLSKFLELRRPKCWLQKVEPCGIPGGSHPFNRQNQHKNGKSLIVMSNNVSLAGKRNLFIEQCLMYRINISRESD